MDMKIYLIGEFDSRELHFIWRYKYLDESYESFNKNQRRVIDRYENMLRPKNNEIVLPLYNKGINENIRSLNALQEKLEFVTEEKIEEMKFISNHVPKSQILNSK